MSLKIENSRRVAISRPVCMDLKQQYSSNIWPLSLKAKRNCIVEKSLKIIKLIRKKCSTFDP